MRTMNRRQLFSTLAAAAMLGRPASAGQGVILSELGKPVDLNALRQVRMVVKNGDVLFPEEIYTAMGIEPFGRKPSLRLPVAQ